MARKKVKKTIRSRSNRSGSMKLDPMVLGGNIIGAIAAQIVVSKLPIQNNLIKSAAPIALGVFLSGNKNKLIAAAGTGMASVGGANLVKTLIPGISGLTGSNDPYIAEDDFPTLGAASGNVLDGMYDVQDGENMLSGASGDVLSGAWATINGAGDAYIAGDDEVLA